MFNLLESYYSNMVLVVQVQIIETESWKEARVLQYVFSKHTITY